MEHQFYFSIYWVSNHPNWRTHIFQRGGEKPPTSDTFLQLMSREKKHVAPCPAGRRLLGGSSHLVSGLVHPRYFCGRLAPTYPIYNQGCSPLTIRGMSHQVVTLNSEKKSPGKPRCFWNRRIGLRETWQEHPIFLRGISMIIYSFLYVFLIFYQAIDKEGRAESPRFSICLVDTWRIDPHFFVAIRQSFLVPYVNGLSQ